MKQFRITVTWTVPYEESELEYYDSPEDYINGTIEAYEDTTYRLVEDMIYYLQEDPTITVVLEEQD